MAEGKHFSFTAEKMFNNSHRVLRLKSIKIVASTINKAPTVVSNVLMAFVNIQAIKVLKKSTKKSSTKIQLFYSRFDSQGSA